MSDQRTSRSSSQDNANAAHASPQICPSNDAIVLPRNPLAARFSRGAAFTTSHKARKKSGLPPVVPIVGKHFRLPQRTLVRCLLVLSALNLAFAQPTAMPSTSRGPTVSPTTSPGPTDSPAPSSSPTKQPSANPTFTFSPTVSPAPSDMPTFNPTLFPTDLPSVSPTLFPTRTYRPSVSPSTSPAPSVSPTASPAPSSTPSYAPSVSPQPTSMPSSSPTAEPTFPNLQIARGKFKQRFDLIPLRPLNETEETWFEDVVMNYTVLITDEDRINTTAEVSNSAVVELRRRLRGKQKPSWTDSFRHLFFSRILRRLQDNEILVEVEYSVTYTSRHRNVSMLPTEYRSFVNDDLGQFTDDLNEAGLDVITAFRVESVLVEASEPPSASPSNFPSFPPSIAPSRVPSVSPTSFPSSVPTIEPSWVPTSAPTFFPSTSPPESSSSGVNSTVIAVVVVLSSAAVLIALFLYYRRRQRQKEMDFQALAAGGGNRRYGSSQASEAPPQEGTSTGGQQSTVMASNRTDQTGSFTPQGVPTTRDPFREQPGDSYLGMPPTGGGVAGMISPTDSLLSQQSLLSVGEYNGGESGDEADDTHHLADLFDEYKDKNLEKMRTEVEGNLTNFDGMMSQALTKALMDDDDSPNPKELLWGGQGDSMEIEASALWEVTGWLKRKEGASLDERRMFMQDTLNKMVASVRHGVIGPEHASRAIHECAAILGLELADDFPEDTIMVTGMRKTVRRENVIEAFKEFGEIDDAAVSANNRGFGLVRFKSTKAVDLAMDRVRTEEIVVQDVAVMCKVVKPEGSNGRSIPSWRQPGFPPPVPTTSDMDRQYSGPASILDVDRSYAAPSEPRPSSAPVTRQTSGEGNANLDRYNGDSGDT